MASETEGIKDCHIVEEENLLKDLKERMGSNPPGPDKSPFSPEICILKVPPVLWRHNPKAYDPDIVSIGPLHPRGKQFQHMETVKQWYLRNLLSRMDINLETFIKSFNNFLLHDDETKEKGLIEFEQRARKFYAEKLDLEPGEFTEMLIRDGCFIIQLVWKIVNVETTDADEDHILTTDCTFQYVCHDLLLLGNQLPWFVLKDLYGFISKRLPCLDTQFSVSLLRFFSQLTSLNKYLAPYLRDLDEEKPIADDNKIHEDKVLHILDLIRTSILFGEKPFGNCSENSQNDNKCLGFFGSWSEKCLSSAKMPEDIESDIPPATALSKAGIKFKGDSANNLMNIHFESGVLTIPELAIGELTEPLFRNLIAFEQCCRNGPQKITSYAIFMDKLISSDEDIELLSQKKIIRNWLNIGDISEFFNKLYIDTRVEKFEYQDLCVALNKYYDFEWHKHFEKFKRDYCSTPWKVIALGVAILILAVTIAQFIITVLQVFRVIR